MTGTPFDTLSDERSSMGELEPATNTLLNESGIPEVHAIAGVTIVVSI